MREVIDLTGNKFGRLMVIDRSYPNQGINLMWLCKCDCGVKKVVRGSHLKDGHTKSCGCLRNELSKKRLLFYLFNIFFKRVFLK